MEVFRKFLLIRGTADCQQGASDIPVQFQFLRPAVFPEGRGQRIVLHIKASALYVIVDHEPHQGPVDVHIVIRKGGIQKKAFH